MIFTSYLISFSLVFSRFIHFVTHTNISFWPLRIFYCINMPHFIYLFSWRYLHFFHFLAIMNKTAVDILASTFYQNICLHLSRSRIAGSQDNSMYTILMNCQIVSKAATPFYISTTRVPISPSPEHVYFPFFHYGPPSGGGIIMVSRCNFDLHFSDD